MYTDVPALRLHLHRTDAGFVALVIAATFRSCNMQAAKR
jgi:hypothetical protein